MFFSRRIGSAEKLSKSLWLSERSNNPANLVEGYNLANKMKLFFC